MKKYETFQELILKLQRFWISKGCLITEASGVEVGAGTLNKNTFLRVLGPEPWSVAYVEPSIRPTDGRYGKNPNRLQHFYQFQVILKPAPKNVQEQYLDSLRYLGIDPIKFDLRFIEDDWEHPGLGAWGLGWEIWAQGMEITQYTYFQQCGGLDLDVICCEITYGLERLAMCLQNVDRIYDLVWGILPSGQKIFYENIHKCDEFQWSHHNFHEVSINMLFKHFDDHEIQAKKLIKKDLILPAYDYVLKCNHEFNLLDARKAISATERASYVGKVRSLAKLCAIKHLKKREKLGFPILK